MRQQPFIPPLLCVAWLHECRPKLPVRTGRVLDAKGQPTHLVSGVTYSKATSLTTCTIVQPVGAA